MHTFAATRSNEPITLAWLDDTYGSRLFPALAIFDFDGVLSDPVEDFVYKIPEQPHERASLAQIAHHYNIDAELYDVPYLRHLILQAILFERQIVATPGPLLSLATEMSKKRRPFFILTARSGRAAIQRVFSFIDKFALTPQEVFFVGRVAKGRQLRLARTTTPPQHKIVFFEDTPRHSINSKKQSIHSFETIPINWSNYDLQKANRMWNENLEWFSHNIRTAKAA